MKKSILATSVAAASVALIASPAFAYDVFDYGGTSQVELHSTKAVLPAVPSPDCNPASVCGVYGGAVDGEVFSSIEIDNKTANAADGTDGPNGPVAAECYVMSSSDYTGGIPNGGSDFGTVIRRIQHLHTPAAEPGLGQALLHNNNSTDVEPDLMNLCTDEEGKITSGTYSFFTNLGPLGQIFAISNYTPSASGLRKSVTFQDGATGTNFELTPTPADAASVVTTLEAGGDPTASTYGPNGDWIFGSVATFAYETCDTVAECGQFSKSVPVPAFAAAALGLGLVGITLLTGRRRQIK